MSQLLWARITYPTLSTFPVGGNRSTRRKPTTFGRALTILFSHEDWVRVYLTGDRTRNLGGERRVVRSDHYTTKGTSRPSRYNPRKKSRQLRRLQLAIRLPDAASLWNCPIIGPPMAYKAIIYSTLKHLVTSVFGTFSIYAII